MIDRVTMRIRGDTESVSIFDNKDIQTTVFENNRFGSVLTSLLNLNLSEVLNAVCDYEWAPDTEDLNSVPPINANAIYQRLLEISDVFKLYSPHEWTQLDGDFSGNSESVQYTITRIKQYLEFCELRNLPNEKKFYDFLRSNNYFGYDLYAFQNRESTNAEMMLRRENTLLDTLYDTYLSELDEEAKWSDEYTISGRDCRPAVIAMTTLDEIIERGKCIRKCQNCGKYFIPENRADTLYCDNLSPQNDSMTCKQYGSQRLWYERQKDDELATLSRNILSAKSMLAKRNSDIPDYKLSYDFFRKERIKWKKAVESGEKSREEYREWLLLMQGQKRIKEAISGNDG